MVTTLYPGTLEKLDRYGWVDASTKTAPLWHPGVKYGLGVECWEATTNLLLNPSFEGTYNGSNDAPNWSYATDGAGTRAKKAMPDGTFAQQLAITTAGSFHSFNSTTNMSVSTAYAMSGRVWASRAGATITFRNPQSQLNGSTQVLAAGWNIVRLTGTTPASMTQSNACIFLSTGFQVGDMYIFDQFQVEQKAYVTPYCDGSLGAGHSWSGTANASTSIRTAGQAKWPCAIPATQPHTMAYWWRLGKNLADMDTFSAVLSTTDGSTTGKALRIEKGGVNQLSAYGAVDASGSGAVNVGALVVGDLRMLAVSYTPGSPNATLTLSIFLPDGTLVGTSSRSGTTQLIAATHLVLDGGAFGGGNPSALSGGFEEILVFDSVLNNTQLGQIAALTSALSIRDTTYGKILFKGAIGGSGGRRTRALSTATGSSGGPDQTRQTGVTQPARFDLITEVDGPRENPPSGTAVRFQCQAPLGVGPGDAVAYNGRPYLVTGVGARDSVGDIVYAAEIPPLVA